MQMKRIGLLSFALAAALTMACNSNARTDNNAGTVGTSGVADTTSHVDTDWVADMMADGDAEVRLAKLAEERATSPDVKRFAHMMVEDHTKAGEQLKKIVDEYNIKIDNSKQSKENDEHQKTYDKLAALHGREFDRQYINVMVDDHNDAVSDLKKKVDVDRNETRGTTGTGEKSAVDTNVRPAKSDDHAEMAINEWAAMTLPTVEHHLDAAKTIQDKMHNNNRKQLGKAKI
jgi:putative membrane protein